MPRHYKSVGKSISTLKSNPKNLMKNVKRCLYISFRTASTFFTAPNAINRNRCHFTTTIMHCSADANSRYQVKEH